MYRYQPDKYNFSKRNVYRYQPDVLGTSPFHMLRALQLINSPDKVFIIHSIIISTESSFETGMSVTEDRCPCTCAVAESIFILERNLDFRRYNLFLQMP